MIVTPKNTRVVAEQVGDNTRYQSPNSAAEVTEELGDDVRARTSAQLGTDQSVSHARGPLYIPSLPSGRI